MSRRKILLCESHMKLLTAGAPPPPPQQILIEKTDHGYKVTWGDLWQDELGKDETIGTIAEILYAGTARYLWNQQQHDDFNKRHLSPTIKLDVSPGTFIGYVCEQASLLASNRLIAVEFTFNDTKVIVNPGDSPTAAVDRYYAARKF